MKALPRANEPGTKFTYNTGETDLVGILVANAVGKSLSQYASEKLWQAYGMERDATGSSTWRATSVVAAACP